MASKGGPKAKKGPKGPRGRLAGKSGTNRRTPSGGASTSGQSHASALTPGHSSMEKC